MIWLAAAGLILGTTIGFLSWAVIDLNTRAADTNHRICATERTDRAVDQDLAAAAGLRVAIPPITAEECPL